MRIELTKERAKRMLDQPRQGDQGNFDEMLDWFMGAADCVALAERAMLYILSPKEQYPRADIALAIGVVEREKGWK